MDENKKPGGSRDISDLKARLGLKKGNTQPPGAAAPGGPVAPPPTAGASVPSPFGAPQGSTTAPPAAPDPALQQQQQQMANLAAFYGLGQQLPGSADSVAAEPISKPKPWGQIGVVAVSALVMFGVGNACGRIYAGRADFNRTTEDAAKIRAEVEGIQKAIGSIAEVLKTHKGDIDFEAAKKLGELNLTKPDTKKIFHTNYFSLEDVAIERLFQYYNDAIQLYDELPRHAKTTEADKESLEAYQKTGGGKTDKNYGVTLDLSSAIAKAQFAELGAPSCTSGEVDKCPAADLRMKYRTSAGGGWGERPLKGKPGDTIIPIERSDLFLSTASGSPDVVAAKAYGQRMKKVLDLMSRLEAAKKDVLGDLDKASKRPHLFTL